MFMYLYGSLEDHLQEIGKEIAAKKAFEEYAKNCPHLELDNDGKATYHICRHPVRDDLSDWVMCDRHACPFMMVNATSEEMEKYNARLTLDSTNAFYRRDHPCKGCAYLK